MLDRINTLVLSVIARAQREEGQSMAEYAMVLALIAVVVAAAVTGLAGSLSTKFSSIANAL